MYLFSQGKVGTGNEARQYCKEKGGYVVVLDSIDEYEALKDALSKRTQFISFLYTNTAYFVNNLFLSLMLFELLMFRTLEF